MILKPSSKTKGFITKIDSTSVALLKSFFPNVQKTAFIIFVYTLSIFKDKSLPPRSGINDALQADCNRIQYPI